MSIFSQLKQRASTSPRTIDPHRWTKPAKAAIAKIIWRELRNTPDFRPASKFVRIDPAFTGTFEQRKAARLQLFPDRLATAVCAAFPELGRAEVLDTISYHLDWLGDDQSGTNDWAFTAYVNSDGPDGSETFECYRSVDDFVARECRVTRADLFRVVAEASHAGEPVDIAALALQTGFWDERVTEVFGRVDGTLDAYAEADAVAKLVGDVDRSSLVASLLVRNEVDRVGNQIERAIEARP